MKNLLQDFESMLMRPDLPALSAGDTVRVSFRVREGDKERIQVFQGVTLQVRGSGLSRTITVRKISGNVPVERIFPVHSPSVAGIELVRKGRVRRARLFYLRDLQGKAARIKGEKKGLAEAMLVEPAPQAVAAPESAPAGEQK